MVEHIGLSTSEALQKLQATIQDELYAYNEQNKRNIFSYFKQALCQPHSLGINLFMLAALFVEVILNVFSLSFDGDHRSREGSITEFIIVFVIILLNILISWREYYLEKTELSRLIAHISNSIYNEDLSDFLSKYPSLTPAPNESISLVWTYRDYQVVNVPLNLLVEGDIIVIAPGEKAPSHCRQLPGSDIKYPVTLFEGDVYNPDLLTANGETLVHPRSKFEVLQTPFKSTVRFYLKDKVVKKKSFMEENIMLVNHIIGRYVIWVVFMCTGIVGLLRWLLLKEDVGTLVEMLCLIPARTVLPLLPLTVPLIWHLVSFYGASRLTTLFEQLRKHENEECHEIILPPDPDFNSCLCRMWNIVKGDPFGIPRTVNVLHTFGNITTFCCIDKTGILCQSNPVPEKVFIFNNKKKLKKISTEPSFTDNLMNKEIFLHKEVSFNQEDDSIDNVILQNDESSINNFNILSISYDPQTETGIQFDDASWENWDSSLKPLGINILLNSCCTYPMKALRNEDFIRHLQFFNNELPATQNHRNCLCHFAQHVGFTKESIENFLVDKQILTYQQKDSTIDPAASFNYYLSIVKEKYLPHISSTIALDKLRGVEQLFSQGTGDLILEACTDLWNGDELFELKDSQRKSALNFFQRMNITGKCIAFSYRPIFENDNSHKDMFMLFPTKEKQFEYCKDEYKERGSTFTKEKRSIKNNMRKAKDLPVDNLLKVDQTKADASVIECQQKNECRQIFLGMITLTEVLKKDVVTIIEQLDNAGIRFVHFSYENELLSRVFCQRLGLETGWNCHISLGECSSATVDDWSTSAVSDSCHLLVDEENDPLARSMSCSNTEPANSFHRDDDEHSNNMNYNELYFMSNRSKLPRGIQHMRSHLEEVDDVPLLVPLFTDCNPSAVSEMMQIMQDYDELTCCIGSSLNTDNSTIFSCSDVSVSLLPEVEPHCVLNRGKNSEKHEESGGDLLSKGPLHLSSVLNSLSCSLFAERGQSLPMAAIFCEARRLSLGSRMCFQFLFSAHLMISLIMFFATIFQLPPPLSGLQILWLLCVVIPLISISLIGTPGEKALMKLMTGKRKRIHNMKEFISPFIRQFIFTFGINALFIVVVMLPWLQYMTCVEMVYKLECHWLLGARNTTSSWNGWYGEYLAGYYVIQDVIMFYVTYSIAVLSVRYVYPRKMLWQAVPFRNKPWSVSLLVCILLQLVYTLCSFYRWSDPRTKLDVNLSSYSVIFYCICVLWLCILVGVGDLVKRSTIREFIRFQKRERLKFNTKLGMNSPV